MNAGSKSVTRLVWFLGLCVLGFKILGIWEPGNRQVLVLFGYCKWTKYPITILVELGQKSLSGCGSIASLTGVLRLNSIEMNRSAGISDTSGADDDLHGKISSNIP